jgi:hypothetical protein
MPATGYVIGLTERLPFINLSDELCNSVDSK